MTWVRSDLKDHPVPMDISLPYRGAMLWDGIKRLAEIKALDIYCWGPIYNAFPGRNYLLFIRYFSKCWSEIYSMQVPGFLFILFQENNFICLFSVFLDLHMTFTPFYSSLVSNTYQSLLWPFLFLFQKEILFFVCRFCFISSLITIYFFYWKLR